MGSYKMFMCFSRKFKVHETQTPPEMKVVFGKYTQSGSLMTANQLHEFLVQFQGEKDATIPDAERIIEQIMHRRHHISRYTRHALTFDDFLQFLFSEDLNPSLKSRVHQDMTAPLSHYFIYTGHNSYLTGNQLSSDCSDIPIIKALEKGVRVIELDIWPNSSKDDVNVLHGRTLTTPVSLIKCLRSIKEYAFMASPYPVVITLEDHLTPDLQAKVAKMVTETFGDMLYIPETEHSDAFPSPEALQYRVMLSTKPPKEYLDSTKSFKDKGKESSEDETWGREIPDLKEELEACEKISVCMDKNPDDDGDTSDYDIRKSQQLGPTEYKRLIAIQAKKRKGGLKESLKVNAAKVGRLSLSEHAFEKATISNGTDIVRFTQKNLLRVYPKGTRVNSSNYKPLLAWMHGAQMVAFNMQGYGRALWLMQGMFKSNGGCGYVRKPDFLTGECNKVFDPRARLPVKTTLKVDVYMGDGWRLDFDKTHFDSYSPPDFYAKVGIAGVPADSMMKKTEIIDDNWTPVWDTEFWFPLTVPELALLRIEVHEYDRSEKDDFGGQNCLPVSELRYGIRTVPLFDRKGEKFKSVKLLMQFQFV
ncbi:phosphoinositide phospholipase C 6-like isoform X2 [Papaver somniferum]|uniref:phosphoinositide phospholipase C 6-like isoform X2 n=1 Tax=Papaver somniferum TaxID=3469 RepID=UPI000E6FA22F|nr:phosphoinositide phospholipase C 6-like isoform X2 [Papaver somniferum]